ncbi:MAG: hypothetical protein GY853_13090 [PVC group bacterium]|nr:hypothetical protein [PVC group bacterium]
MNKYWLVSDIRKIHIFLFICILLISGIKSYAFEEEQIPALIHISSTVSDGRYELSDIVDEAEKAGFKAVVFTDRLLMRWEYGLWPLRKIIKSTVENNSIFRFGIEKYLQQIEILSRNNPEMVLIGGVDTTPFYYWEGDMFKQGLTLNDSHKHMLVVGLDNPQDLSQMPVMGNSAALYSGFKFVDFWPFLIIIAGIICLVRVNKYRIVSILLLIIGGVFLVNNFPFRTTVFDQYQGDKGILPYQNLINHVEAKGGMTFWTHPEAENIQKTSKADIVTKKHPEDLLKSKDYTGFTVFYEGYQEVGRPGGVWDEVLLQYISGKRQKPVWAIGGMAFDYSGSLEDRCLSLRNILLIKDLDKMSALESFRKGRLYVLAGKQASGFMLDDFVVLDKSQGAKSGMGQTLLLQGAVPHLKINGHFLNSSAQELKIKLIKNKEVVKTFVVHAPLNIEYSDGSFNSDAYYRVEIQGKGLHVITNPIFVRKEL